MAGSGRNYCSQLLATPPETGRVLAVIVGMLPSSPQITASLLCICQAGFPQLEMHLAAASQGQEVTEQQPSPWGKPRVHRPSSSLSQLRTSLTLRDSSAPLVSQSLCASCHSSISFFYSLLEKSRAPLWLCPSTIPRLPHMPQNLSEDLMGTFSPPCSTWVPPCYFQNQSIPSCSLSPRQSSSPLPINFAIFPKSLP